MSFASFFGQVFSSVLSKEKISIAIESSAHTASFDLKSRTLTLPEWNLPMEAERFLVCHETGHAIFTPLAGWVAAISEKPTGHQKLYGNYLNVVEDARIDRLMQRKYPIMERWYYSGVKWLENEKQLFASPEMDTYPLIDRLNIFFKTRCLGAEATMPAFSPEELPWIERIDKAMTFEEVKTIADELFELAPKKECGDGNHLVLVIHGFDIVSTDDIVSFEKYLNIKIIGNKKSKPYVSRQDTVILDDDDYRPFVVPFGNVNFKI